MSSRLSTTALLPLSSITLTPVARAALFVPRIVSRIVV
jgi:hypothetical protein